MSAFKDRLVLLTKFYILLEKGYLSDQIKEKQMANTNCVFSICINGICDCVALISLADMEVEEA